MLNEALSIRNVLQFLNSDTACTSNPMHLVYSELSSRKQ